jgi:hypothetical protein
MSLRAHRRDAGFTAAQPSREDERPVLVTGSHRSGTTWVGKMLCLSNELGYVQEPFNPRRRPGWSGNRIPYWYLYVTKENEHFYEAVVEDILAFKYPVLSNLRDIGNPAQAALFASDLQRSLWYRLHRPRPLIKDPIALFASEWLATRFDMQVIVTIRHPLAFAGSIKRLGWQFKFRSWLAQERLLRDWLEPFEDQMRACWNNQADIIDQAIVMWNALHHLIAEHRRRHSSWIFVRHEDLVEAPIARFKDLYERVGVRWSPSIEAKIHRHTASASPKELPLWRHQSVKRDSASTLTSWRHRLTDEEIERIRTGTSVTAKHFYEE